MSKVRSTIAVCVMSLFAAVALFPSTAGISNLKGARMSVHSNQMNSAEILIADGGEPQPPIPVPPGAMSAS